MKRSTPFIRRVPACLALCTVALLASGHAMSQQAGQGNSVQLKVTGSLVPPACSLTLPSGDSVDYGRMLMSDLSPTDHTILPERSLGFAITCDSPAHLSLLMTDQNPTTTVHGLINKFREEPNAQYIANGLGKVGDTNIGIYYVRVFTGNGNNRPGELRTIRSDGTQGWSETPVDAPLYAHGGLAIGFTDSPGTTPTPMRLVTGRLAIQTVIRPRAELPATGDIVLNGMSTLELKYQ